MAAHEAPLSLGFSRQEHWSGLPFPSPKHESESEVAQPCPTLSDPMACGPPGSSVHGIFQARVLEWGAIAFSSDRARISNQVVLGIHRTLVVWPWSRGQGVNTQEETWLIALGRGQGTSLALHEAMPFVK